MPNLLIAYHVPANAGYAIASLERVFYAVVNAFPEQRGGTVHLGYKNYENGKPAWLADRQIPLLELDFRHITKQQGRALERYLKQNRVEFVLAFDLDVEAAICSHFRRGGVKKIISYFGCPISGLNAWPKLWIKRLEVMLTPARPTHFIFESFGMRKTATHGRGLPASQTSVVKPGVDLEVFNPHGNRETVYRALKIPAGRKIFIYTGHMEERKGVRVILQAAAELVNVRQRRDVHFLICGNRDGEKERFDGLYRQSPAEAHITFGGYRRDIPELLPGCYAGIIASTGWDSHTLSAVEMAACGLPLLVSDLVGLKEAVVEGKTGYLFTVGDHLELADRIDDLVASPAARHTLSNNAVERARRCYSRETQKKALLRILATHCS